MTFEYIFMMRALAFVYAVLFGASLVSRAGAQPADDPKLIRITTAKISLALEYSGKASITEMIINGQKVISNPEGGFTSVKVGGTTYTSKQLKGSPTVKQTRDRVTISGISYGDQALTITENWIFTKNERSIEWKIERTFSKSVEVEEVALPEIHFNDMTVWEGAYQGYGGLAWFYLFNEKLCTYGVHTTASTFWNSKTGNALNIQVKAPGRKVAVKYTRADDDKLAYSVAVSEQDMVPLADSGTNRRRFIRKSTAVWSPFRVAAGTSIQSVTFRYVDYQEKYGRGTLPGVNGAQVAAVLNTIARIGVIDSLHFGGNSWHTPYGPICLHEQYIAQMGLGINDPDYLKGYQSCLDHYRDHAIKPDGRVYSRWAYTNEDASPGAYNDKGFYEAQWGILMDSNPDLVTNVSELYDLTGDLAWVKQHQASCEKALDWILRRDTNNNGLVEMMTDVQGQQKSSDWIDIIWASYENAFVNAKLYTALIKWSAIERHLNNPTQAARYQSAAAKLKASFNRSTRDGGFWDEEKGCYVHWRDKDNTIHGRNMVTPVNFMAIAYGICQDHARKKTILDAIETQMQREHLFFWPLTMTSYEPGEGKEWQFPFPEYENGDLFLSWGAVAVKAYAEYNPAIALKYVNHVLAQYGKDGLAYQRYGRTRQDGRGDDILSGNSLAVVGLYQAIYGINPLYNRLYLDPHITPELAGTELKYNFHNQRLTVNLDPGRYTVAQAHFKIIDTQRFGFQAVKDQLLYFHDQDSIASLQVTTLTPLTLTINTWSDEQRTWEQTTAGSSKMVTYTLRQLKPDTEYTVSVGGKVVKKARSNKEGELVIQRKPATASEKINISHGS